MAGGIVINGRFVARPGVYSSVEYITIPGAPTQGGVLAVVGDFPFLQQNTPYLSTSERDFKRIAASNATLLRMANIIYAPLRDADFAAAPAGVYLVSPTPTTQAFGMLLDNVAANSIKVLSRMWGPQGNQTRFRITPNVATGGWDVVVANNGVQENIRVPAEPSPAVISYEYPVAVPVPGATPHTSEGFGEWLSDTGSAVSGTVAGGGIAVTFTKVLLEECVADTSSHVSWEPNGPVNGVLSCEVPTGAVLSLGVLTVAVTGVDNDTGLPATDTLTFSVAECLAGNTKPTPTSWASVSEVKCYTAAAETFTGSIEISGANFPTLNEANGQTTVAAALQFLTQFAADGFTSTTSSTRTASILLTDLDTSAAAPLPLTLSADTWKIVSTVNASSNLVELEDVGTLAPSIPVGGTFFFLVGGSQSALTAADWGDALEELRWYNVDDVAAFYDPTGTPPASDAVLPYFKDHITTMWADGANERILWSGAGNDEAFSTLVNRAAIFNSERCLVVADSAYIRQYQGAVELQRPYWYALMHAAASASLLTVNSLTRANLRVEGVVRNSATYDNETVNELIRAGLVLTSVPPGAVPRVEREVTTWTTDTNAARTEGIATRSVRDSLKDMRDGLDAFLSPSSGGAVLRAGDIKAFVEARLEQQKSAYDPIITDYVASSVTVTEIADRFEVGYVIVVRINKNFITLNVGVTVPAGTA